MLHRTGPPGKPDFGLPPLWATLVFLLIFTSVRIPVRHNPKSSPRKASSTCTVGFIFPAKRRPGNSSSVFSLVAFPKNLQSMPNLFVDLNVPAYYAGKTLECALTHVRRFGGSVRPGRVSGGASFERWERVPFFPRENRGVGGKRSSPNSSIHDVWRKFRLHTVARNSAHPL